MFYFLSKAIDFLVMPFSIFFILCLFALLSGNKKRKKIFLTISLCWLVLVSNSYLVNKAFNWWEYEHRNISSVQKTYDVGIVLSGGMTGVMPPGTDHPSMGPHGDRFLQAFLLYKAGKIKKILITGTSPAHLMRRNMGETREAAKLLVKWGIKPEDILFEEKARNTRENALFTSRILSSRFPNGKYLLITSSFHMRRSMQCFIKAGVHPDAFAADFYGNTTSLSFDNLLIPKPDALANFDFLWHEWVGYLMYKLVGYC